MSCVFAYLVCVAPSLIPLGRPSSFDAPRLSGTAETFEEPTVSEGLQRSAAVLTLSPHIAAVPDNVIDDEVGHGICLK